MQSQRTARREDNAVPETIPVSLEQGQPRVVDARSPIPADAEQALRNALEVHRYALMPGTVPAGISADEGLFNAFITTLASIPEGETRAERIDEEYVDMFTSGRLQFMAVFVPPDDAYKNETLTQFIESLAPQGPGHVPHYSIIRDSNDPSMVTLVNNWFVPFSEEERVQLSTMLLEAGSRDANTMMQALFVYSKLFELGKKMYALNVSDMLYSGLVGDTIHELSSHYERVHSAAFSALSSIVHGNADAAQLLYSTAQLAESAEREYSNALHRIAYAFESFDPAPRGSGLRRALDMVENPSGAWSQDIAFSEVERQLFHSLMGSYNSILGRIRDISYEMAAYLLGVPPGSTFHPASGLPIEIGGMTEPDIALFREFRNVSGQLQLFVAKAKFLQMEAEYREYVEFRREIQPDAGFLTDEEVRAEARRRDRSDVLQFLVPGTMERYQRELREMGGQLLAYAEMVEDVIVHNTPALTQYFGAEEKRAFFSGPRGMRAAGFPQTADFDTMFDFSRRYLSSFSSSFNSMLEKASEIQENIDLQTRFREGGFWDKAYAFSKHFLNERGTEFLVLSTIATAGIGGAVGLGGAGVRATASAFARGGFATAAALTTIPASIVLADGIYHFGGEGIAGQRAEQDIRLGTQFLMCGGMAWAGGTGMVSRLFSTSAFGAGTVGAGLSVYRDVQRGDILSAIADTVVYGAGAYMFIRGINGIQQIRLSQPIADTTVRLGSPFGLQTLQLPKMAEWVAFPYSARGLSTFYIGFSVLDPIISPDEFAAALEGGGFDALRSRWNEMYAQHAYTFPAANLVFEAAIAGGRAAWGAIRGPRPPANLPFDATAAEALQIPVSNPSRMAFAASAGAGERAIVMAKELGMNLEERELLRRLYTIALGDARLSAEEVAASLGAYRPSGVSQARFDRFARELSEEINGIWASSALMEGGTALTRQEIRSLRDLFREASRARRKLVTYGLGGLAVGGIAYMRTRDDIPYYRELNAAQQNYGYMLDVLASDPANEWFVNTLLQDQFQGFLGGQDERRMELLVNSAFLAHGRIEGGDAYSAFSERLRSLIPDQQKRFNLAYAASLALSQREISDPGEYLEQLGGLLHNITLFMSSHPEISWDGLRMGDFFILSNYLLTVNGLDAAKGQLDSLISSFRSDYTAYVPDPISDAYLRARYMVDATDEAVSSREFARIALALLHQAAVLEKPDEWAGKMMLNLFYTPQQDPEYRAHPARFFSNYRGEVLAEAFGNTAFASGDAVPIADFAQIIMSTYSQYPVQIYYPETSRFFRE